MDQNQWVIYNPLVNGDILKLFHLLINGMILG